MTHGGRTTRSVGNPIMVAVRRVGRGDVLTLSYGVFSCTLSGRTGAM